MAVLGCFGCHSLYCPMSYLDCKFKGQSQLKGRWLHDKIFVLIYEDDPHDQVCMVGPSLGTSRTSLGRADKLD